MDHSDELPVVDCRPLDDPTLEDSHAPEQYLQEPLEKLELVLASGGRRLPGWLAKGLEAAVARHSPLIVGWRNSGFLSGSGGSSMSMMSVEGVVDIFRRLAGGIEV